MADATIRRYAPNDFEREVLRCVLHRGAAFTHYADSPLIAAMRRRALQQLKLNGLLHQWRNGPLEVTPAGRRAIQN
jgi:hypothetical protein